MADPEKIAKEIKSKGFSITKCDMENESPDKWVMFGVWFYLKQNFFVDLDWRTGKYYFYLESAKEEVEAKEPKNKSLDFYSAEDYLSSSLLKHYDLFKEIADTIHTSKLYITENSSVIEILDDEENQAVLFWIVDENGDTAVHCACNRDIPLMMISPINEQEKLLEEAKNRGFEIIAEKPDWADDEDIEEDESIFEHNIVGFENYDIYF